VLLSTFFPSLKSAIAGGFAVGGVQDVTITPNYISFIALTTNFSISAAGTASCTSSITLYPRILLIFPCTYRGKSQIGIGRLLKPGQGAGLRFLGLHCMNPIHLAIHKFVAFSPGLDVNMVWKNPRYW